ncbi:MAG: asparagine synthase C-terminal domain-containing protein [Candidatus Hodarchaeales archaeon]
MNQLLNFLTDHIQQNLHSEEVGILYSGGIDSSIVLKILIDKIGSNKIKAVTVGMKKSYDVQNAMNGAKELGIKINIYLLDSFIINSAIDSIIRMNVVSEVGKLAIALPLYLGMRFLLQNNIKQVFLGQGADELFGGYQKYVDLYKDSKEGEIRNVMNSDLHSLVTNQQIMEKKIANNLGLTLVYPFLSPTLIKFAQSIPIKKHIIGNRGQPIRKALLRKLASDLNLSSNVSNQPKKALQYGSGTVKLLRKIAKDAGYPNLPLWFEHFYQT